MAHAFFLNRFDRFGPLSRRVYSIPKNIIKLARICANPRWVKKIGAGACVLSALVLGVWAKTATESEVLKSWNQLHRPSNSVWEFSLKRLGFSPSTDKKRIYQLEKQLLDPGDSEESVWKTKDSAWVALLHPDDPARPELLFCADCQIEPRDWERMQPGWIGFEETLAEVQKFSDWLRSRKKLSFREPLDPREIRY